MSISFMTAALLAVSVITNLTVEGLKVLLNEAKVKYSANLMAAIVAVVISLALSVGYMVLGDVAFSAKICVQIIVLMYGGFLVSTVGYDKVLQTLDQLKTRSE